MREVTSSKSPKDYLPLVHELEELHSKGIKLTLDGKQTTPENIARECLMSEDSNYMRDYVTDGKGNIVGIDFNKINLRQI
ncbi:MAG: hypothetical protein E7266_03600 [Lachnospiraceae bacterium]|nr:hypothetical protein [Lachnospiraceae bacterium]